MTAQDVLSITIELSMKDAEHFRLFQEHYSNFVFLLERGAFNKQRGKIEFNKDQNGVIADVSVIHRFDRKMQSSIIEQTPLST